MNKAMCKGGAVFAAVLAATSAMGINVWAKGAELNVAYQYGLAYAPVMVAMERGLIEEAYKDETGKELKISWNQMAGGADINTGFASGDLDVGFIGIGPGVTGVVKGVGYKIFSNISGQAHEIMSNDKEIQKVADMIGTDKQMALVNIGSYQHILLAMALAADGEDPHALDSNLIAMKHPDGMTALQTGTVAAQLTTNPYIYMEQKDDSLHQVGELEDVWSSDHSFIVGIASEELHDNDPKLYNAVCSGISDAIDYINDNPEETAELTAELDGNSKEDELEYLKKGTYSVETKGVEEYAKFMYDNAFLDSDPGSYEDLVFDNVKGD